MRPLHRATKGKRKLGRKSFEDTKTSSSPMASKKCQEEISRQECGDGGGSGELGTAKRAKHGGTTTDPPTSELADSQGRGTPSTYPKVPVAVENDAREATQRPFSGPDTNQPQPSSAENDERRLGSRFWEAEYWKLKEIHDRYWDETRKELALLKKKMANSEIEIEDFAWTKFHERKEKYARDRGYILVGRDTDWEYGALSREIRSICHDIGSDDLPTTLAKASGDPEYYLIAGECSHPWVEQILSESSCEDEGIPLSFWVVERLITRYVLYWTFGPMLVGLDKEVESLLLRVRANMESRMVPVMAYKWMGETLRSYTLLPKYDQDRDDYLRNHTRYLQNFVEHFFPIPESIRHTAREDSAKRSREEILEKIIAPAADLAAHMSFSYAKFEVDWDYCERTAEVFYKHLDGREYNYLDRHEVWERNGAKLARRHFPGLEAEEKIGDVILFVRPPIFLVETTGFRRIYGIPIVIINPVSSYTRNPPRQK